MNIYRVHELVNHLSAIEFMETAFVSAKAAGNGGEKVQENYIKATEHAVHQLILFLNDSGLMDGKDVAIETALSLARIDADMSTMATSLHHLKRAIMSSLQKTVFLRVEKDFSGFIDQDRLFGQAVYDAFPSSQRDIKEAGNCLAADCGTASVFHLMRAVESALRALAVDRDLTFKRAPLSDQQWGNILDTLEGPDGLKKLRAADRTRWPSPEAREAQIRFYNDVIQELRTFNDKWRRHVSHADPDAFYDCHDAKGTFNHVRTLMQKLATKIDENSVTPEFWPNP